MLVFVVLGSSFTLVFSLNSGCFFVAVLKIRVDLLCDSNNLVLHIGDTLNPKIG